jgi:hypothetical protein
MTTDRDPCHDLVDGLMRFTHAPHAEAVAAVERICGFYDWSPERLTAEIGGLTARIGINPAALLWWMYSTIDLMKTAETRRLIRIAAGIVTIIERCNLLDPPDGEPGTVRSRRND